MRLIQEYCQEHDPDTFNQLSSPSQSRVPGMGEEMMAKATAFLYARYCLMNSVVEESLRSIQLVTPLPDHWWELSPTVNDLSKAFVAGNVRTLREESMDRMEDLFPTNNDVCYSMPEITNSSLLQNASLLVSGC